MDSSGKIIREALHQYMPYYFGFINPILHKENTEKYALNENQVRTLFCINFLMEATPTIISQAINIQKGSLTTIIKSLIKLDLITKEYDNNDDRRYYLSLTDKGNAFIEYKQKKQEEELNQLFSRLNESDVEKISEGFHILSNYLKQIGK